jgi:HK97 family phage major capsid protein/HK97 family phage prohead protease
MKRAYSVIDFRSVDDEKRIIEGIASTPAVDSYQTILEPQGAEFKLPLPVLYQHNSRQPIGKVIDAKVSKDGIRVRLQIAKAGVTEFIDEAWALIREGLVRGLSVGFDPIEETFDKTFQGIRFTKWRWLELSTVTIAANTDATMTSVRSADEAILAALGTSNRSVVRLDSTKTSPGVSGLTHKGKPMKTIAEQIAAFEAKEQSLEARNAEIMNQATEAGRTLEEPEVEEYDNNTAEIKTIGEHLVRLRAQEKRNLARAKEVTAENTKTEDKAKDTRRSVIEVKSNAPKGIGVARMAMAMIRAKGNPYEAIENAKRSWPDNPEIQAHIRTVIEAGDTTTSGWASQLIPSAQQMDGEFLDMLRDKIVIGRIPGLRRVPFNVSVPLQSGAGTYGYVGEGAPKPVTKPTYGSATLRFEKAAGIIVITQELARFSTPSAELLVRDEMIKGLTAYFDSVFVSAGAAVTNVMPAGILNGISATAASGTTAAFFRKNFDTTMQKMITNKRDPAQLVILMSAGVAMTLSSMINSLGQQEFPSINATGGNYLGVPIVTSQALGTNIVLIDPSDILLAEDPGVAIDISTEASVEMDDAPTVGESSPATQITTLKSFWQNNLVGIRCEQFRTWKVARSSAVEYISGAAYALST